MARDVPSPRRNYQPSQEKSRESNQSHSKQTKIHYERTTPRCRRQPWLSQALPPMKKEPAPLAGSDSHRKGQKGWGGKPGAGQGGGQRAAWGHPGTHSAVRGAQRQGTSVCTAITKGDLKITGGLASPRPRFGCTLYPSHCFPGGGTGLSLRCIS